MARGEEASSESDEALGSTLSDLWGEGRACHPSLALSDERFAAHLGRCGVSLEAPTFAADLYLAAAALEGVPGAVELLRQTHHSHVVQHARLGQSDAFVEEVEQRLWDSLLVGADGASRLATYSGAGPLRSWVGISAQRIALMMLRHENVETRARTELAANELLVGDDPELAAIKDRYRDHFQRAIEGAISGLEPRAKLVYRMYLVEGLSLERIGKAYRVHQSTVSRWLSSARDSVISEAKRTLRAELNLSPSEFDSLVRLLVSQLDLNLSQILSRSA
jgi:RNA polymerase sigma-70 factor